VERPSRSFAYPNGGPDDFDGFAANVVRAAGLQYAVTTIEAPNAPGIDPYAIRRYGIGADDDMGRFGWLVHHARHVTRQIGPRSRNGPSSPSATAEAGGAPTTSPHA
jgi:hypothetical protein